MLRVVFCIKNECICEYCSWTLFVDNVHDNCWHIIKNQLKVRCFSLLQGQNSTPLITMTHQTYTLSTALSRMASSSLITDPNISHSSNVMHINKNTKQLFGLLTVKTAEKNFLFLFSLLWPWKWVVVWLSSKMVWACWAQWSYYQVEFQTSCDIICGAPVTLAVKGLTMMMMSFKDLMQKASEDHKLRFLPGPGISKISFIPHTWPITYVNFFISY